MGSSCGNTGPVENQRELSTSKVVPAIESGRDYGVGPREDRVVEPELAVHEGVQGIDPRACQLEQPADVCRQDKVPRRPHHV